MELNASRFGVEPPQSLFSPKSPRNYKYSIADMLVKTTGNIAMVTVKQVTFIKAKYGYTRRGHLALYCQTLTSDEEGKRRHNMWWAAKDPHYSGRLWNCKSIMAGCDCVTEDTLVSTPKGLYKVKNLIGNYTPGSKLTQHITVSGSDYAASPFFYKGIQNVYRVYTSNGQVLTLTKDHEVRVLINGKEKWRRLRDLTQGSEIVINKNEPPVVSYGQSYEDGYLVGLVIGDGSFFRNNRPDLQLYGKKKELVNVIKNSRFVREFTELPSKGGIRVKFTKEFKDFLLFLGVKRGNKVITTKILENTELGIGVMAGLYDTDGCSSKYRASISSTSMKNLRRIQVFLNHIGVWNTKINVAAKKGAQVTISGNSFKRAHSLLNLTIGSECMNTFFSLIKPKNEDRLKHFNPSLERRIYRVRNTTAIVDIKPIGKKEVYDVSVDKVYRFSANGLVIHNCKQWLYRCEYAWWYRGLSDIIYSNGAPPLTTNPRLHLYCCKHLLRSGLVAVSKKF